jgi:excinuclease ABC subunit B
VAILDADKEGFLRSATSLIQTIGRAARNVDSKVILYADKITNSMKIALGETDRRRAVQIAYNTEHGITPASVRKKIGEIIESVAEADYVTVSMKSKKYEVKDPGKDKEKYLVALRQKMLEAASDLEFEDAARIRDMIAKLEKKPGVKKRA